MSRPTSGTEGQSALSISRAPLNEPESQLNITTPCTQTGRVMAFEAFIKFGV